MMTRNVLLSIVFSLVLGISGARAQTVNITKEQFDKITQAASAKSATLPRRETTNAKKFESGKVVEEELTTQDYSPPDKERWLILARTREKHTRIEIVYIGETEYRREDKNPWKKIDRADQLTVGPDTSPGKARPIITYTREDKSVDGMRLQVLVEKSNMAYSAPGLRTRRITLDAYGYVLKIEESLSEGVPENVVFTSVTSIVYSSHPIIIEAPIK